jgi:hypothetical protein
MKEVNGIGRIIELRDAKIEAMKKVLAILAVTVLMSCGNANDGDATSDTTNFNNESDTGAVSGAVGDTGMNMDPSTGTDTTSRPYSGSGGDTSGSKTNSAASGSESTDNNP